MPKCHLQVKGVQLLRLRQVEFLRALSLIGFSTHVVIIKRTISFHRFCVLLDKPFRGFVQEIATLFPMRILGTVLAVCGLALPTSIFLLRSFFG